MYVTKLFSLESPMLARVFLFTTIVVTIFVALESKLS